ncbi:variable surface lipoprotein [Mycoplasmopsis bovis]|uniref:Lipoprotein n=2 Tax=Mycoplasmopsis bovis TaxID=28903 RepID=A0A8D4D903_MYCBV|nr:variable surface lipoprotein [Mycoplasmopsis bovis]AMW25630.1 lipoprotein [Mycoplasmopsis bovis]
MKKTNKIIISLSSIISISSMPLIAASCQNKNPTDKSIINNITPPQKKTIDNQKQQEDKSKEEKPNGSGNSSQDADPQTKDNQNHENPNGSGNSSSDADSQTQDIQKRENKNKKEENDDPKYLLEQLEEVKNDYEKTKKENEDLIKNSEYFDELNRWFGNIYPPHFKHEWNYYSQFGLEVKNTEIDKKWLKLAKDFIQRYKTEIKKDLENLIK